MNARASTDRWSVIVRQLRPEGGRLGLLAGVLLVATALPLAGPILLARFVDEARRGAALDLLTQIAVMYLVVTISGRAARVVATYLGSGLAWRVSNRLRELLAEHALRLDMDFHGRHTPGEMIERVDGDLLGLTTFISTFVVEAISAGLLLVGTIAVVLTVNVRIGLGLMVIVVVAAAVVVSAQRRVVPHATAHRQAMAMMLGSIEERLGAAEDIRANGAGGHVIRRFHEDAALAFRTDFSWQARAGAVLAATNLVFATGTAMMVGAGIYLMSHGSMTLGTVVLLFQYSQIVRNPIEAIVEQAKSLQQAGAAAARVAELLAEPVVITEPSAPRPLAPSGAIALDFRGVSFNYPGDPAVLHDITLSLPAGRTLGLVGRTGSGKTTLARLAVRLYDPTAGAVELDGVDARQIGLDELHRRLRIVTQEVHVFTATLRENLTLYGAEHSDAEMRVALGEVGLGEWFERLPAGLDTVLAAGAAGLSAGEAQLVAFARVFLADPGLVVLDEASSRLDAGTEVLVRQATRRMLAGRTAIVIAHRLATLAEVDYIAVVEDGELVEFGARADLLVRPDTRFASLMQAAGLR